MKGGGHKQTPNNTSRAKTSCSDSEGEDRVIPVRSSSPTGTKIQALSGKCYFGSSHYSGI